jgi:hypothetical protein
MPSIDSKRTAAMTGSHGSPPRKAATATPGIACPHRHSITARAEKRPSLGAAYRLLAERDRDLRGKLAARARGDLMRVVGGPAVCRSGLNQDRAEPSIAGRVSHTSNTCINKSDENH